MKALIRYVGTENTTTIENNLSFKDFILELFKKKIYLSLTKSSISLAINTDNIISVEEVKE